MNLLLNYSQYITIRMWSLLNCKVQLGICGRGWNNGIVVSKNGKADYCRLFVERETYFAMYVEGSGSIDSKMKIWQNKENLVFIKKVPYNDRNASERNRTSAHGSGGHCSIHWATDASLILYYIFPRTASPNFIAFLICFC